MKSITLILTDDVALPRLQTAFTLGVEELLYRLESSLIVDVVFSDSEEE